MTAQKSVSHILPLHVLSHMARHPRAISQKDNDHPHTKVSQDYLHHMFTLPLICSIPRFDTDGEYLDSFKTTRWTSYEFGRIGFAFTTTVK
ncbi:hypothetical protein TNCV_4029331 [Trichonephila clavipes]|nr:hypothetical protein TNCV_4029331 [Trichonephila clavipes]